VLYGLRGERRALKIDAKQPEWKYRHLGVAVLDARTFFAEHVHEVNGWRFAHVVHMFFIGYNQKTGQ